MEENTHILKLCKTSIKGHTKASSESLLNKENGFYFVKEKLVNRVKFYHVVFSIITFRKV